ncbi:MAG: conjugal transfer protein TrbE [Parasphingorhabdus sp.]|uniref:conjugal transfer protein TrbE n=1 Tax=Parasphingorhabdus sp. TaxID=2709688 RepID=UPI0030021362
MLNLSEYARKPKLLADYLPWAAMVDPGIVLNKDGSLQRSARFRGPDLDSATPAELVGASARLNNALRRLGSGWAIFVEAQRLPAGDYPVSVFPDAASAIVDEERRAGFEEEGAHFISDYVLTLLWLPPEDQKAAGESWLYEGREKESQFDWREHLKTFADRTQQLLGLIETFMPEARWLDDEETLSFLHSCISTKHQKVRLPEAPIYLDALIADEPLTGGLEPKLGNKHLRTLSVVGFPGSTTPELLDDLNRLAFPYRWSTRALCLDKTDATRLLGKIRRQWFAKRKSVAAIIKEVMTNEASILLDSDAANKAEDADQALQELGADYVGAAYITITITVSGDTATGANARLAQIEKIIQSRDFTCIKENINALEAWMGSLPGHVYANVRSFPVSTLNLAHLMPLSAVWAGPEINEHLSAPPLFLAKTQGSTPFRFSGHVGDVGHMLVVGPTGAGKSVLLSFIAMQFRRYESAKIFAFDFGGSIRAAMLAMGGEWQDLGGNITEQASPITLQPLRNIDEAATCAWAAGWIASILAHEGVVIDPDVKDHIWTALQSLASAPVQERTLTGLSILLQNQRIKQALAPYCLGGSWGEMLDADEERLGQSDLQAFETEGLMGSAAAPAVLSYLFHRIECSLTGDPALIIIDEGWLALADTGFGATLREWLKTLRKKNASVVFATQSLSDIDGSSLAPALIESCPTRIFLPNDRALEPQITAIYRRFGLNDRQIEMTAHSVPKRDYYAQSRDGNRLFDLGLGPVALAFCASSSKTDHAAMSEILSRDDPAPFAASWLRHKSLDWAADLLPTLTPKEN